MLRHLFGFDFFVYLECNNKISIMKEFKFAPGDYLLSKRFGWQYKIISIRNGVAVLQDIVRENVRVRFTLLALRNRIEIDSFAHSPHPF